MIYKGYVPSIQYELSLDRSKSTGEIDSPSLIFIDLYVPALTPLHHGSEVALQLSENIALFMVSGIYTRVISKECLMYTWCLRETSFMYKFYKVVYWTEACGTPTCISLGVNILPSTETWNFLFERSNVISLITEVGKVTLDNLYSKPGCHVVSKVCLYPRIPQP
jgi:hypothetical protein